MHRFLVLFRFASMATLVAQPPSQCSPFTRPADFLAGPAWNGWGPDASNARFQPQAAAKIPAAQIARLTLKWAFGFPNAKSVLGAPVVACGRVFLGVDTGLVYSLDAATCAVR